MCVIEKIFCSCECDCRTNREFCAKFSAKSLVMGSTAVVALVHNKHVTVANGMSMLFRGCDLYFVNIQSCDMVPCYFGVL
jgi:hypothetical protein